MAKRHADPPWKKAERKIARFFGSERNQGSGSGGPNRGNSEDSKSDSTHNKLYIEAKYKKKHTAITLWDDTKTKAKKEKKIPVTALCEHGRPGFWLVIHSSDLIAIARERYKAVKDK
jgi:hypothetical protein